MNTRGGVNIVGTMNGGLAAVVLAAVPGNRYNVDSFRELGEDSLREI